MKAEYLRSYDPQEVVTNKFAVGERIEWKDGVWQDENSTLFIECFAGIIKKITPCTVVLYIEYAYRRASKHKEIRIGKYQLAQDVLDWELGEAIKATIGQDTAPKNLKANNEVEKTVKNDIPHDAYRLRDPRDKAVFYVGISKNSQRRYKQHLACAGLNFKLNIRIQEILQCGLIPQMEIIEPAIPGAEKAREREKHWISYHIQVGDQLTNIAEMDEVE